MHNEAFEFCLFDCQSRKLIQQKLLGYILSAFQRLIRLTSICGRGDSASGAKTVHSVRFPVESNQRLLTRYLITN